ncbi:uncharacterized protein LOC143263307 [Megalopta genalis]|uniref:uncharacterized protein LOC143263307 n=1 Tax=Megalopta genalis TaxID=115081 RepID=UPI003FD41106
MSKKSHHNKTNESVVERIQRLVERQPRGLQCEPSRTRSRSPIEQQASGKTSDIENRLEKIEQFMTNMANTSYNHTSQRPRSLRYDYVENEKLIPIFDPARDDIEIEKWIEIVDEVSNRLKWDDSKIKCVLGTCLRGMSRHFYNKRTHYCHTWAEMKLLLLREFQKTVPFHVLFKKCALYEALPGQSLEDYCSQKLAMLRRLDIPIPEKYLIDMVIRGIWDDALLHFIRSKQFIDTDELYTFLKSIKHTSNGESSKEHTPGTSNNPKYQKKSLE